MMLRYLDRSASFHFLWIKLPIPLASFLEERTLTGFDTAEYVLLSISKSCDQKVICYSFHAFQIFIPLGVSRSRMAIDSYEIAQTDC